MDSPVQAWRKIAWSIDEFHEDPRLRELNTRYAWMDDNSSFDNLYPHFKQLKSFVPDFFENRNLHWIFERESYEFPQEVLSQNYALETQLSIYIYQPEFVPNTIPSICPRFTSLWNIFDGTPSAIPKQDDYSFITVPYAWFDLISIAMSAIVCENHTFFRKIFPSLAPSCKNISLQSIFDTLSMRLFSSQYDVPEILQKLLIHKLCNKLQIDAHLDGMETITARTELETACQRYTIAHEIGHIIGWYTDTPELGDDETFADRVAFFASQYHSAADPAQYTNYFSSPSPFVQCLGSELFLCVHKMWCISIDEIDTFNTGHNKKKSKRDLDYKARFKSYENVRGELFSITKPFESSRDQTLLEELRKIIDEMLCHYREYLYQRSNYISQISDKEMAEILISYPDPWDLEQYNREIDEAIKRLSSNPNSEKEHKERKPPK